jgi:hypothetical protein
MMIAITVLGFLLIEEGLNEILNPRRANALLEVKGLRVVYRIGSVQIC